LRRTTTFDGPQFVVGGLPVRATTGAGTVAIVFAGGIGTMLSAGIVYLLAEIAEHTLPHSWLEMEAERLAASPPQPGLMTCLLEIGPCHHLPSPHLIIILI
jgi:hypothetical protein